jgi:hypothetical protein
MSNISHSTLLNLLWSVANHTIDTTLNINDNNIVNVTNIYPDRVIVGNYSTDKNIFMDYSPYGVISSYVPINEFTYSLWIYPTDIGSDYHEFLVSDVFNDAQFILATDSQFEWYNPACPSGVIRTTDSTISVNTWNHVVLTKSATGTIKLYLNNVSLTFSSNGCNGLQILGNLYLGCRSDGNHAFKGAFDELGIWDIELTSDEVSTLYNNGNGLYMTDLTAPQNNNLTRAYHFDENGNPISAYDWKSLTTMTYYSSPYSNTGFVQSGIGISDTNSDIEVAGNITSHANITGINIFGNNICYSEGTNCDFLSNISGYVSLPYWNNESNLSNLNFNFGKINTTDIKGNILIDIDDMQNWFSRVHLLGVLNPSFVFNNTGSLTNPFMIYNNGANNVFSLAQTESNKGDGKIFEFIQTRENYTSISYKILNNISTTNMFATEMMRFNYGHLTNNINFYSNVTFDKNITAPNICYSNGTQCTSVNDSYVPYNSAISNIDLNGKYIKNISLIKDRDGIMFIDINDRYMASITNNIQMSLLDDSMGYLFGDWTAYNNFHVNNILTALKIKVGSVSTSTHTVNIGGATASLQMGDAFAYSPNKADFAVGSSNSNSRFLFGQSNGLYGGMIWNYHATTPYLSIGMGGLNYRGMNIMMTNGFISINKLVASTALDVNGSVNISNDLNISGNTIFKGNITYNDTFWEDANLGVITLGDGVNAPTKIDWNSTGVEVNCFAGSVKNDYVSGCIEMPHSWKEQTNIYPHLHWAKTDANNGYVVWNVSYFISNQISNRILQGRLNVSSITPATAWNETYIEFNEISMTNFKLGTQVCFRLERLQDFVNDSYSGFACPTTIGIHYEIDSVGSREEFVK